MSKTKPIKRRKFDISKMTLTDNLTDGVQLDDKKVVQILVRLFGEDFKKEMNRQMADEKLRKEKESLNKSND